MGILKLFRVSWSSSWLKFARVTQTAKTRTTNTGEMLPAHFLDLKIRLVCSEFHQLNHRKGQTLRLYFHTMEQRTLRNVNNYLNTNIYSYLETSGGQNSSLYLKVVHFFNTTVN
jgi:hypothetical protein